MPLDLQSLSTDTLLYMLMHSAVFVAVMGAVFFLIGLIFGYATWGRFKIQARRLAGEIAQQREEIATLKRKLGDHSVKPGSVTIATETIAMPSVSTASAAPESAAHPPLPPPSPALPADPITDTIALAEEPATASLPLKTKAAKSKTAVKAKTPAEPKTIIESKSIIEPLPAAAPLPAEASAAPSPLAAIIATHPAKAEKPASESLAAAVESLDIIPALPELPPAEVKPETDPKLGLIYKTPPLKPDDLTAMKGIARVLEQRLHEFGIYTYEQISLWTEDQIREFSSRLAFKDRIHREKWVEQAKRLQAEKQKAAA